MPVPRANEKVDMMWIGECVAPHCKRLRLTQLNESIVQTDLTRHNAGAMRKRTVGRLCQTPVGPSSAFHRNALQQRGFTLIELLVVIAIIAILIGLLFPAFSAVQNQAKRTQAKNDLTQIVTAVNAYYTEYGKYPLPSGTTGEFIYGPAGNSSPPSNAELFYTLRAVAGGTMNANNAANPRIIVFISPPYVKNDTAGNRRSGVSPTDGNYYDPWGTPYDVEIDGDYNNDINPNPYTANTGAGPSPMNIGVIAWSLGKDATQGTNYNNSDDVISWQ
jgi:prepilin-type N-terminal cleavage/methylation domain-containing protein